MATRWMVAWAIGIGALGLCAMAWGAAAATQPASRPSTQPVSTKPLLWEASDEEYAVYSALLKYLYVEHKQTSLTGDGNRIGGIGPVITQVVLAERTIDRRLFEGMVPEAKDEILSDMGPPFVPDELAVRAKDAAAAYDQANLRPAKLDAKRIRVEGLEIILFQQESYRDPEQPVTRRVYQNYPKCQGITLISRVGFSKDGTKAIVEDATMRAFLYGHGMFYLLEKTKDGWRVVGAKMTWIS